MPNGSGSAPTWSNNPNSYYQFDCTDYENDLNTPTTVNVGGIHGQSIVVSRVSNVIITCRLMVHNFDNTFGGIAVGKLRIDLLNNSNASIGGDGAYEKFGNGETFPFYAQVLIPNVLPGTYTISAKMSAGSGDAFGFGNFYMAVESPPGRMIVQVLAN